MERANYRSGRLTARPVPNNTNINVLTGIQPLRLESEKENFVYIPKNYHAKMPASFAVMLHGSGGIAAHGLSYIRQYADEYNIILLATASQDYTWDIIANDAFNKDVIFLDGALQHIFEHYTVDPEHVAIGGFSDGASYALCLGLTNGDLFRYIIAFSPGFALTIENNGCPAVFISHGVNDHILPISSCSRRIVPKLKGKGLLVSYHEFDGEHIIPAEISQKAVQWFIEKKAQQ